MRSLPLLLSITSLALAACGGDDPVEPAIIPGGGVHDPFIDGLVNVYVIDDDSDLPIANATVRVGTVEGTTDATGLFVAKNVLGPQTILARAAGHAASMWVGVDGANVTIPLTVTPTPTTQPPQAQLSGSITGWDALPAPATNHLRVALVSWSQDRDLGARDNEIKQPPDVQMVPAGACVRVPTAGSPPCAWKVNARTGTIALSVALGDLDTKGTATDADDVLTISGFSIKQPITVVAGANQTGLMLDLPAASSATTASIDFGTPPSGLTKVGAIAGLELGANGILRVASADRATTSAAIPSLSLATGATYEFIGIAEEPVTDGTAAQSIVLHRGITSASGLAAGAWLPPPTGLASDRATASFTRTPGADLHIIEFDTSSGSGNGNRVLSIGLFDDSSQVTLPTAFAPLPSGSVTMRVNTIDTDTNVDLRDFEIDTVVDDAVRVAADTIKLN